MKNYNLFINIFLIIFFLKIYQKFFYLNIFNLILLKYIIKRDNE